MQRRKRCLRSEIGGICGCQAGCGRVDQYLPFELAWPHGSLDA